VSGLLLRAADQSLEKFWSGVLRSLLAARLARLLRVLTLVVLLSLVALY
jgi:hypothetical protein